MTPELEPPSPIDRAFGFDSRKQLLTEYFASAGAITTANAWLHVYRLLLWADRTTGLAHCYESDKAQPGRPWYGRSLAFHDWLSSALGVPPHDVATQIDWLFRKGTERLADVVARQGPTRSSRAAAQRAPYLDRGFPEPGEDAPLESLIRESLAPWLTDPPADILRRLTREIQLYFGQENKRKNLVGEGFEDVLAGLIQRIPQATEITVHARPLLHDLPGFRSPPGVEKARRVDLGVTTRNARRLLISAKWSIRADREEQFEVDFATYARLEEAGKDFEFVLITNEFDAARLLAACSRRRPNGVLFNSVVHVNPLGPISAYGTTVRGAALQLAGLVESGRLVSLEQWLNSLVD